MIEMIVPTPESLRYRCAMVTMKGKYTINGVRTFTGDNNSGLAVVLSDGSEVAWHQTPWLLGGLALVG